MSFKKGKEKTGGRKSGTPNLATNDLRLQFQNLFENNFDNLQTWLDEVGKDNPAQAISLFLRLSKFIIPELQRINVDNDKDIVVNWHEENNTQISMDAATIKRINEELENAI